VTNQQVLGWCYEVIERPLDRLLMASVTDASMVYILIGET
jgi:hypothetical protein